jgi:hypothetical protein
MNVSQGRLRWVFPAAAACFVFAGLAGVLFRYGLVMGFPFGLHAEYIRHAHSHLMYFSWVTPLLMAMLAVHGVPRERWSKSVSVAIGGTFVLGLMAFVPFLMFGYTVAEIGTARIPFSMIAAGLNVIPWYVFAVWYLRNARQADDAPQRTLFAGAVVYLVLASLGAWALAYLSISGQNNLFLERSALHIFLDYFSEGWLVLGVLGLMYALVGQQPGGADLARIRTATVLLLAGLSATFLLPLPATLVPVPMRWAAALGGVAACAGLALHIGWLWSRARGWRIVLFLLAVKTVAMLAYSLPGVNEWAGQLGARLLYLHILLLGFVTLGLIRAAVATWLPGRLAAEGWMVASVFVLLASLLPLTRLFPAALMGRWVLLFALAASVLPVLSMIGLFVQWHTGRNVEIASFRLEDHPVATAGVSELAPEAAPETLRLSEV